MAYEHSEGWGAASTKIVICGGFRGRQNDVRRRGRGIMPLRTEARVTSASAGMDASNESPCQLHVYGGASHG